ncbi:MAG: hypothetical protein IKC92_02265 [Tidjanibacter sp.]|nr:hypothetical protein [Tidjanibacter sp.]
MRFFAFCAALLLFVGCSEAPTELVDEPAQGVTFYGVVEEADSRVFLDNQIRICWNAEDLISVYTGISRNFKYMFLGDDGDYGGEFEDVTTGFGSGNPVERNYALYPYASTNKFFFGDTEAENYIRHTLPATQTYKENSIAPGANVMVAVTSDAADGNLVFRNVCSYLRVKLYGVDQRVGSIVLTGNNDEILSGYMAITPVYGGVPSMEMLDGTKSGPSLTLTSAEGVAIGTTRESATEFWLVVPPISFSKGFTLTVNGFYGGSQSFVVNNNLTFARNTYNTITRELTITSGDTGMGVGGWGNGSSTEGSAE